MSSPQDATVAVITAYVATNQVPFANLPPLVNRILQVFEHTYKSVIQSATPSVESPVIDFDIPIATPPPPEPTPEPTRPAVTVAATPIVDPKVSVFPTHIICLHCGARFNVLTRHIRTQHGQNPTQYRLHFDLPDTYPMIVPDRLTIKHGATARRPVWKPEWAPLSN